MIHHLLCAACSVKRDHRQLEIWLSHMTIRGLHQWDEKANLLSIAPRGRQTFLERIASHRRPGFSSHRWNGVLRIWGVLPGP